MTMTTPNPRTEEYVTGCAVTGRMLAFETLAWHDTGWLRSEPGSRLFHLGEHSRMGLRKLASEIHQFASEQQIKRTAFCRTLTGEADDEVRIEALLCMIPGLEIDVFDGDNVLHWSAREKPAMPRNVVRAQQSLAQLWAIDLAQFSLLAPVCEVPA
jgi:hypothetical protein